MASCTYLLWLFARCFFFKQKTAYELRISDWSSDVCSSDLFELQGALDHPAGGGGNTQALDFSFTSAETEVADGDAVTGVFTVTVTDDVPEIGRASCRERGCQYV